MSATSFSNDHVNSDSSSNRPRGPKSSIPGAVVNFANVIVGAGIVGTPYALSKTGLLAGVMLLLVCATMNHVSNRMLIQTGNLLRVTSYETLSETVFGSVGLFFMALVMLVNAYGCMVSYLILIKDSLAAFFHVEEDDTWIKAGVLFVVTLFILLPISCQGDKTSLVKFSSVSILLDISLVVLVLTVAPIQESIEESGGLMTIVTSPDNLVHWNTIFIGLGVYSFAFVCQHASFLVSDSMERPTLQRWSLVSKLTMILSGILTMTFGIGGYLAYGDTVSGDILKRLPPDSWITSACSLVLGVHMMLVYPMESFVARHICMLFRRLSRGDSIRSPHLNRVYQAQHEKGNLAWTVGLYGAAMIPTILVGDVGIVLSIVGSITASTLAYLAPGMLYLGCHGQTFLRLVRPHASPLLSQASGDTATTNTTRDYQGNASESQPLLVSVSREPCRQPQRIKVIMLAWMRLDERTGHFVCPVSLLAV